MTSLKSKRFLAFLLSCLFLITTFAGTAMVSAETTITDNGDGTYTLSTGETWAIVSTSADDISYDLNGDGTADTLKVFTTMGAAMATLKTAAVPYIGVNGALTATASKTASGGSFVALDNKLYVRGISDDAALTWNYHVIHFSTDVDIDNIQINPGNGNDSNAAVTAAGDVTLGNNVTSTADYVYFSVFTGAGKSVDPQKDVKVVVNSPNLKSAGIFLTTRHSEWINDAKTYGDPDDPSLIDITIEDMFLVNHGKGYIQLNNYQDSAITYNANAVVTLNKISYWWGSNQNQYVRGDNATWNGTVTVIANNGLATYVYDSFKPQVDYYVDADTGVYAYVTEETKKSAVPTFEITVPTGTIPVINGAKSATLTDGKWYYTPAADTDTTAMETLTVTYEAAPVTVNLDGKDWVLVKSGGGLHTMDIDGDGTPEQLSAYATLKEAAAKALTLDNPYIGVVGYLNYTESKTNDGSIDNSSKEVHILGLTEDAGIGITGYYNNIFNFPVVLDDLNLDTVTSDEKALSFKYGGSLGSGITSVVQGTTTWDDQLQLCLIRNVPASKHVLINLAGKAHVQNLSLFNVDGRSSDFGSASDRVLIEYNIDMDGDGGTVDAGASWNGGINMGTRQNSAFTVYGNTILTIDQISFINHTAEVNINGGARTGTSGFETSKVVYDGTVTVIQHNGLNIPVESTFQAQVDYLVKVAAGGSVAVTEATKEATLPTFEITAPAGKTPFVNGVQATLTGGKWYYTPAADADTTTMETLNVTFEDFDVTMIKGASIRFKTPAGIRFGANLNGLDALTEAGYTYKVGMLIAVTNKLSDIDFTAEAMADADVKFLDIETKVWNITPADGEAVDYQTMNVAYNIPSEQYGTQLSGRAYVDVTKGDVTTRYYAAYSETDHVRSIRKVAEEAIASGKYAEGSTQYTDLQAYL